MLSKRNNQEEKVDFRLRMGSPRKATVGCLWDGRVRKGYIVHVKYVVQQEKMQKTKYDEKGDREGPTKIEAFDHAENFF